MSKDYSQLSKDELLKVVEKLEARKKYGLVWDEERTKEIFEKESQDAFPILNEVADKNVSDKSEEPIHLIIEGDNYHTLSVLNYTHQGKIDVIYVDPPYNTGNNSWRYNNDFVDSEDAFRHSKWLSFMSKRLRLAKNLLRDDGIFIITIDDYELYTLGVLLDEIFGENNRIGIVAIEVNPRGRTTNTFFATSHEYILYYAKNITEAVIHKLPLTEEQIADFNLEDEVSKYRLLPFRRSGGLSTPEERPNSYYPIYYNEKNGYIGIDKKAGCIEIFPVDSSGKKRVWRQTRPSLVEAVKRGDMVIKKGRNSDFTVLMKDRIKEGRKAKTIWVDPLFDSSSHGTVLLQKILGKRKVFDYPKSLHAVIRALDVVLGDKDDAIVLDFFAGSGTTGHAILEINNRGRTNHQFILATNNENKICEDVCYPRLKKVMLGYKTGEKAVDGLGGFLKYFRDAFVKRNLSRDHLKMELTRRCTEMLCLREGIFDEMKKSADFRIFKQGERIMAVYYSLGHDSLVQLKKELDKIDCEKILYCFTLDPFGLNKNDFDGWDDIRLEPIPQKILDVYEEIYANNA